jgi:hypothetical protein
MVCHCKYNGKIKTIWGIYGHEQCIKRCQVNTRSLKKTIDIEHLKSVIPINQKYEYSNYHDTVWCCNNNGGSFIPHESTLAYYMETFSKEIEEYKQKLEIEREEKLQRQKEEQKLRAQQKSQELRLWKQEVINICKEKEYPYTSYIQFSHEFPLIIKKKIVELSSLNAAYLGNLINRIDIPENFHNIAFTHYHRDFDFNEILNRYLLFVTYTSINSLEWTKLYYKFLSSANIQSFFNELEGYKNSNVNIQANTIKENTNLCQFGECNNLKSNFCCQNRCNRHCCSHVCNRHRCAIESIFIRKIVLEEQVTLNV